MVGSAKTGLLPVFLLALFVGSSVYAQDPVAAIETALPLSDESALSMNRGRAPRLPEFPDMGAVSPPTTSSDNEEKAPSSLEDGAFHLPELSKMSSVSSWEASSGEEAPRQQQEGTPSSPDSAHEELERASQNSSEEESLAQPERKIHLPDIPDMKPISALQELSSEEENEAFLQNDGEWRQVDSVQKEEVSVLDTSFSGVRFAPLPDRKIAAIPDMRVSTPVSERHPRERSVEKNVKKKSVAKKAAPDVSQEAYEALADMRRRQLEAIESDRKTLKALREALSELGLENKLSFMAKGGEKALANPEVLGMAAGEKKKEEEK